MLTKTILTALEQDSSSRKKPIFLLYIIINAANIDVNLDPNKTSIFFKEEVTKFIVMVIHVKIPT